ncbi:MAG: hypothetical protein HRT68_08840 [Flavobacteriaceae bacterium]|nr:hypothetical protein [Flavobacteriaceae bacterium]
MSNYDEILLKLEAFTKKFYTNELIKGIIFFASLGLIYFFFTLFIESFLWLKPLGRGILFWTFIVVEVFLFIRYIILPLTKLSGLRKGITNEHASDIIGNHFPDVSDKLKNLLQLGSSHTNAELILASINQKSKELQPIPFRQAIDLKENKKYWKYAVIPVLIYLISLVTGTNKSIKDSYNRVINYDQAYTPPAPFQFFVINNKLKTLEGEDFVLYVRTEGKVVPENVSINYNGETYLLKQKEPGSYYYTFKNPKHDISFNLNGNDVRSRYYNLQILSVPSILDFKMEVNYPPYLNKQQDIFKNTGNAIIPEGTQIIWNIKTNQTDEVSLQSEENISFSKHDNEFSAVHKIYKNLAYQITTSNKNITDYENLNYKIKVIKDQYPDIKVYSKRDSINQQYMFFLGNVSDDYGLTKLNIVYFKEEKEKKQKSIAISKGNFSQFSYTFPDGLDIEEGENYQFYFEIFDNDQFHNYKSSKSQLFNFKSLTQSELETKQLEQQSKSIQGFNKSLEKLEDQEKELDQIAKNQKEKKELSWNDKKKLDNFIKRQQQQDELMKNFNKQLNKNLEDFNKEDDNFKKAIQERLENQEKEIEENEKLLEELKELQDKIREEDLAKKIENLKKQNSEQQRSLEQLVELTKRYYVTQKTEKLRKDLEQLAKEQEELSTSQKNSKELQDKINKKFEDLQKQLDELRKENKELKKPMDLNTDEKKEQEVKQEQKEASQNLQNQKKKQAQKKQKSAAKKMQQMSESMMQMMQMQAQESLEEDAKMLRQILDNLLFYSFDQEDLIGKFKEIDHTNASFSKRLKDQQRLREHFKHVDDSLFALSLRNPMISDKINKEVTDVHFNIDKSLELFAETDIYKGTANQQYAVTAANNLADYLSDVLNNMQNQMMQMMPGAGQCDKPNGSGQGFQLSDIIQEQESNIQQMKQNMGDKGKEKGGQKKPGSKGDGQQKGEGNKSGSGGDGDSEQLSGELYKIFQQQQALRKQLEDALSKDGKKGNAGNLTKQMEEIEEELLDKGFTNEVIEKMQNLKHELLKLEDARLKQGQDNKREANTNQEEYNNSIQQKIPNAKEYFNEKEILDRQALPLQTIYKEKVNTYFKKGND